MTVPITFLLIFGGIWLLYCYGGALVFWLTSRFIVQPRMTWGSCIKAAVTGMTAGAAITIGGVFALLPVFIGHFDRSMAVALAMTPAIPAFFVASFLNRYFMRKQDGGRITYSEACRVEIPLMIALVLLIAYSIVTRPPDY